MPIEAIVFDKDGTLFDFQVSWSAWAMAFLRDAADGNEEPVWNFEGFWHGTPVIAWL